MRWIETPATASAAIHAPLSPVLAARMRLNEDHEGLDTNPWWSALLDLREVSLDTLMNQLPAGEFLIPSVYSPEERQASQGRRLVAVFVRHRVLRELNEAGRQLGIFGITDGMIHPDDQIDPNARYVEPDLIGLPEKSAIMAVIDDGIAIANDLFRDGITSSRVRQSWIMAARPIQHDEERQTIGRSFGKSAIDGLLKIHTHADLLDEPAFYRSTGQIEFGNGQFSPVSLTRSHGTHIAALAAGHPMARAVKTRPLICVSLPPQVTEDTTGQSSLPALALALQFIHHHAKRFHIDGRPAPIILNFSFGNYSGPHDSTGDIAALFDQFLTQDETQVRRLVLPAGNSNLTKTHAEVTFPDADCSAKVLHLKAPPDDRTATHVQMWMPRAGEDKNFVDVSVSPPMGPQSPTLRTDGTGVTSYDLVDDRGMLARLSYVKKSDPVDRGVVTLTLAQTAGFEADTPVAPAGIWEFAVAPDQIRPPEKGAHTSLPYHSVQAWIRRDETLPGFKPSGRQAQFEDPAYVAFGKYGRPKAVDPKGTTSLVRRGGSLSGFACGSMPVVSGGAIAKELRVSPYSASGPISPISKPFDGTKPIVARTGPDLVGRSDDSFVLSGVISAGSHSGSFVRQAGTSVAAPGIARALACELCDDKPMDPAPIDGPISRTGAGYLCVDIALLDLPGSILAPFSDHAS